MGKAVALADTLGAWEKSDGHRQNIANTIIAIAGASVRIADVRERAPRPHRHRDSATEGRGHKDPRNLSGQVKAVLSKALVGTLVSAAAIGRTDAAIYLHNNAPLYATLTPLDGASGIDANMPVGTIFSLLPAVFEGDRAGNSSFLQAGSRQVAAGYIISGPRTMLVLTVGAGTQLYTLDRRTASFELLQFMVDLPTEPRSLTINATVDRSWDNPMRR